MPSRKSAPIRRRSAAPKTTARSSSSRKAAAPVSAAQKVAAAAGKARKLAKSLLPLPWSGATSHYVTVYLYGNGPEGPFVASTAPDRVVVRRGDAIYWSVVKNFADRKGEEGRARVEVRFNGEQPLDRELPEFARLTKSTVSRRAKKGTYRYTVFVNKEPLFDPEVMIEN